MVMVTHLILDFIKEREIFFGACLALYIITKFFK